MGIVWTLIILGVMIFIHELGHFVSARIFGVHVEEFAMGMGPAILKKQKGETLYALRAFPLGGYCKMEGEDGGCESAHAFSNIAPWKRLIVLASGAMMNILLALILFIIVSFSQGDYVYAPKIGAIADGDAPAAVFEVGDIIVKMDNTKINIYADITLKMMENNGEDIKITVDRNGEKITKTVTPYKTESGYKIGFSPAVIDNTPGVALKNGVFETAFSVKTVFWSIKQMITGRIGLDGLSGPVGFATVVGDAVTGAESVPDAAMRRLVLFLNIAYIAALIGANLGVMNLLPLPALDGGRILFTLVEMIIGKKVPEKFEAAVHAAGFVLLMILAAVVTWSDISKLIK